MEVYNSNKIPASLILMPQPSASERGVSPNPERIILPSQFEGRTYFNIAARTGGQVHGGGVGVAISFPERVNATFTDVLLSGPKLRYVDSSHPQGAELRVDAVVIPAGPVSAIFVERNLGSDNQPTHLKKVTITITGEIEVTESDLSQDVSPEDSRILEALATGVPLIRRA
jgi:hypothetical protein